MNFMFLLKLQTNHQTATASMAMRALGLFHNHASKVPGEVSGG
jgi:ABC-type transporter Mla maintaining outer membrane lipid asymmetry ATPase subunit MlaF